MRRLLALVVLLAMFTVPSAALAAKGGGGGGGGNGGGGGGGGGGGRSSSAAEQQEAKAERQADKAAAKEEKAAAKEETKEQKAAAKQARAEGDDGDGDAAEKIPTGNAQKTLAGLLESGKLPPKAAMVIFRVLTKLQEKHGAAIPLPPAPGSTPSPVSDTVSGSVTDTAPSSTD